MATGEVPALWFGNLVPAATARRRRPAFIDRDDLDACSLGLVTQDIDELSHPPSAGGQVLPGPGVAIKHAAGITHHQEADAVVTGEMDHGLRRLVAGLRQAPAVATFEDCGPHPILPPPSRSRLALGRGPSGQGPTSSLRIGQMQPDSARSARPDTSSDPSSATTVKG